MTTSSCRGPSRRELLTVGGIGLTGLSLPSLLHARETTSRGGSFGRARSCIVLFLLGGPPQHETWDPKPDAVPEIRGDLKPIASRVPGIQVGELMPRTAQLMQHVAVLRGVATDSNAHSSSGYEMLTGFPHPRGKQIDNLPISPSDRPSMGAIVRKLAAGRDRQLPAAVTLPTRIFNNGFIYWPGQGGGFLGREWGPWMLTCEPAEEQFQIQELSLPADVAADRLAGRRRLLGQVGAGPLDGAAAARFDSYSQRAIDLLSGSQVRRAFDLRQEPAVVRDRYGRHSFGQSCLLARRLIEAGSRLVQVNWPVPQNELGSSNPVWDTHQRNTHRLKTNLMPPWDLAYSALLEDLDQRGLLEETLVVCLGEFGRTPKVNDGGGRDHWGHVFSVALAGGGVRGGQVHGASDRIGGYPRDGRVGPADLTATILHALGIAPDKEIHDVLNRPYHMSHGDVLHRLF